MASETLIRTALQLAKQLGANTSKFMGTKSNVSFLGSGPKDGMLFQQSINPESFATIGIKKVLPDIETSMSYLTGGKLNDIQTNKLIENMSVMLDVMDPLAAKNVVDASSKFRGGLESLEGLGLKNLDNVRAKSGLGERQATEAASDIKSIDDAQAGVNQADAEGILASAKVGNPFDNTPVSGNQLLDKFSEIKNRPAGLEETGDVTGIMKTIDKVDLPGKRAASREFLVNSLKVGDDYPSTTLSDVMSAQDMKFIMEGGGGVMGDPIVLVQKYFGPRIAEMVPNGGTAEEISIFTRRVMDNVEDAKGLKPDEQGFDAMTARFIDEFTPPEGGQPFAKGGRAGYAFGGNPHESDSEAGSGQTSGKSNAPPGEEGGGGYINPNNLPGQNNNPPPDTIGGGGITDVVPTKNPGFLDYLKNPYTSLQKFAGVYKGPEEEEEENKVSSNLDKINAISQKGSLYNNAGVAIDARTQANLAKAKELGFKKGGLAKILEL